MYRPPISNLLLFYGGLEYFLNVFNINSHLVLTEDINIDVINVSKYGVAEYLNMLSGFGIESIIGNFLWEESLGTQITSTCIDHIVVRLDELNFAQG